MTPGRMTDVSRISSRAGSLTPTLSRTLGQQEAPRDAILNPIALERLRANADIGRGSDELGHLEDMDYDPTVTPQQVHDLLSTPAEHWNSAPSVQERARQAWRGRGVLPAARTAVSGSMDNWGTTRVGRLVGAQTSSSSRGLSNETYGPIRGRESARHEEDGVFSVADALGPYNLYMSDREGRRGGATRYGGAAVGLSDLTPQNARDRQRAEEWGAIAARENDVVGGGIPSNVPLQHDMPRGFLDPVEFSGSPAGYGDGRHFSGQDLRHEAHLSQASGAAASGAAADHGSSDDRGSLFQRVGSFFRRSG